MTVGGLMGGAFAFAVIVPAVALSFVLRTVGVLVTARRYPLVADWIRQWWIWGPFVVACLVMVWFAPLFAIPVILGMLFMMTREGALGSPFRPRP